MEASGMDDLNKLEAAKLTSVAAFVEGGIQEACDDACSICLEDFCDSDPATITGCKHEFHLQCILEWCQRSSQCPMCLQPISLKDPAGQELLDAVVQERDIRLTPPSTAAIFHHPTLGDFEIQHLPVGGVNDAELEERIIQHLAAAAAMGRARHIARRDGHRTRSSAQGRPHFLVLSSHPSARSGQASSASPEGSDAESTPAISVASLSSPLVVGGEESSRASLLNPSVQSNPVSGSVTSAPSGGEPGTPLNYRSSPSHSSPRTQDRAGPSDFQSFSDALRSRLNAVSTRYKESISKSTRGWKEKWFSRNSAMADLGSEVRREVNAGIATVSRMMERLETRDNVRTSPTSVANGSESRLIPDAGDEEIAAGAGRSDGLSENSVEAHRTASSGSV